MKSLVYILLAISIGMLFYSCQKEEATDKTKPEIVIKPDGFPQNCDTLYFGQPFIIKIWLYDNQELGSYSIDIHHNFDHHSHSTEVTQCNLDPIKQPVNPYVLIQDYKLEQGLKAYETSLSMTIPAANVHGQFDEGDYHFFISLTDKEGWSSQKGLNIKLLH